MFAIVVDHFEITPSALIFMSRNGRFENGLWYWEGLGPPPSALVEKEMLREDAAASDIYDTSPYYEGRAYITVSKYIYIVDPDAPSIGGANLYRIGVTKEGKKDADQHRFSGN